MTWIPLREPASMLRTGPYCPSEAAWLAALTAGKPSEPAYLHLGPLERGGENLYLAMVRQGAAFAFRKYLGQCNSLRYLSAESEAEFRRAGVWATPGGITRPWDWRAESRGNTPAPSPRPPKGQASGGYGVMTGGGGSSGGGGHYYCKNLSKQEAQRLLDRDGDGEACEGKR